MVASVVNSVAIAGAVKLNDTHVLAQLSLFFPVKNPAGIAFNVCSENSVPGAARRVL
jgi:hypothetical protein